ncbi:MULTISPECIES: TRAP transporter large permease [Halomonadaceae]|jgi:tripartite ATP-independent transporter DctM subunit|uniref:TRAP transporter large permease protein n=1 Tax=Vreelandella janggokensis TaxID=370767 RepID=A0ABT4ITV9_9GAMM|nr:MULTISPECIES: TRAP transporter large permease [Halomonas]MCW4150545.1 TRAP transporter large permease [Halomonas sp. 18H]MCZ0927081.1 TRAP transporter large permease [Halomonas janggokensis]MCZ0929589.1 TRAP transporter large permease [Halomonas janggokensis]MDR5886213.1 TRAP transporter large permease [Halomonas janggokensis]QPL45680.1 TRAP transporter large permease [Halomonas sp. A40-4]
MLWIFLGILFVSLALGLPIAFGLGIAAVVMAVLSDIPLSILIEQSIRGVNSFPLLAIPFFIMVGEVMSNGGIARRLMELAGALVGFVRGGLGQVAITGSMFFGGISGSAVADTAATGAMMIPSMTKQGYTAPQATAINTVSSVIGIIIPPSIPLILFGIVTETSISRLFIAGIVPGILIGFGLMATTFIMATIGRAGQTRKFRLDVLWQAFKAAWLALVLPVLVIGGIIGGIFTATEAAVAALLYSLFISLVVYREFKITALWGMLIRTARLTGMVLLLLAFATVIAWFLTINMVPQTLVTQVQAITQDPFLLLLIVAGLLLLVGFVMDLTPAMVIMAPMLTPIVESVGIDPVYFGVLMAFILGIGLLTPPVGTCLYVGCGVGKVSMEQLVKAMLPYYATLLVVLVILIAFPGIVTWLPDLTAVSGN